MGNPSSDSGRILVGLGLGLIVLTGLSMQFGIFPPNECDSISNDNCIETSSMGLLIPIVGLASTILGLALIAGIKVPIISNIFPNQSDQELEKSLKLIEEDIGRDKDINVAWATLEEKVLSKKIGEEE